MGPFAFDIVKTSRVASALIDQVELVSITDADLILSLAARRVTIARIDQR